MFLIFYQLQSTAVFFMRLVTGLSENLDKQKGLIYMHTKHFRDRLENMTDKSLKHNLARYIEKIMDYRRRIVFAFPGSISLHGC